MAFGGDFPSGLFPPLPDSLVKAKDSFVRRAWEIFAQRGLVEQDIRVPAPLTPSPALFATLSLTSWISANSMSHSHCSVFRPSNSHVAPS